MSLSLCEARKCLLFEVSRFQHHTNNQMFIPHFLLGFWFKNHFLLAWILKPLSLHNWYTWKNIKGWFKKMNMPSTYIFCYMLLIFHLIRSFMFVCVCGVPVSYILDISHVVVFVSVLELVLHSFLYNHKPSGQCHNMVSLVVEEWIFGCFLFWGWKTQSSIFTMALEDFKLVKFCQLFI